MRLLSLVFLAGAAAHATLSSSNRLFSLRKNFPHNLGLHALRSQVLDGLVMRRPMRPSGQTGEDGGATGGDNNIPLSQVLITAPSHPCGSFCNIPENVIVACTPDSQRLCPNDDALYQSVPCMENHQTDWSNDCASAIADFMSKNAPQLTIAGIDTSVVNNSPDISILPPVPTANVMLAASIDENSPLGPPLPPKGFNGPVPLTQALYNAPPPNCGAFCNIPHSIIIACNDDAVRICQDDETLAEAIPCMEFNQEEWGPSCRASIEEFMSDNAPHLAVSGIIPLKSSFTLGPNIPPQITISDPSFDGPSIQFTQETIPLSHVIYNAPARTCGSFCNIPDDLIVACVPDAKKLCPGDFTLAQSVPCMENHQTDWSNDCASAIAHFMSKNAPQLTIAGVDTSVVNDSPDMFMLPPPPPVDIIVADNNSDPPKGFNANVPFVQAVYNAPPPNCGSYCEIPESVIVACHDDAVRICVGDENLASAVPCMEANQYQWSPSCTSAIGQFMLSSAPSLAVVGIDINKHFEQVPFEADGGATGGDGGATGGDDGY